MLFYYFLALLAAFCWSISSLISADLTRTLGGIGFNRLRLIIVSIMLLIYATFQSTWNTINVELINTIIVSGIIGVFLGDTLLFMALQRIGPRRNNILFSLAAPFTVFLNIFVLQKNMSLIEITGCIIVFIGVVIAGVVIAVCVLLGTALEFESVLLTASGCSRKTTAISSGVFK